MLRPCCQIICLYLCIFLMMNYRIYPDEYEKFFFNKLLQVSYYNYNEIIHSSQNSVVFLNGGILQTFYVNVIETFKPSLYFSVEMHISQVLNFSSRNGKNGQFLVEKKPRNREKSYPNTQIR